MSSSGFAALDRRAIADIRASGRHLLVQGAMGLHSSDGLAGKVASAPSGRMVCVGTISGVGKTPEILRAELRREAADAGGGYVGVNLMAAIDRHDFTDLARVAIEERASFIVQGAGISREIVRWCREAGTPFAGIVSSGRLAAMYERWGAEFLVAEGAGAGGHIGDIHLPLVSLIEEVRAHTTLPVVAAGGIDAGEAAVVLATGVAGLQLATRFIACSDGDAHAGFKEMHLGKGEQDVVVITSCVKGMKARAVRNAFTEALAAGECFPPRSKAWFFGGRRIPRPAQLLRGVPRAGAVPVPGQRLPRELLHLGRPAARGQARRPPGRPLLLRPECHPDPGANHRGARARLQDRRRHRGWDPALGAGAREHPSPHHAPRSGRPVEAADRPSAEAGRSVRTRGRGELSVAGRRPPDPRAHRDRP